MVEATEAALVTEDKLESTEAAEAAEAAEAISAGILCEGRSSAAKARLRAMIPRRS